MVITSRLLNTDPATATAQAYMRRFGSLRAAYRLIGYVPARDITYGDMRESTRPWRASIVMCLRDMLVDDGSVVEQDGSTLRIDGVWTVDVRLLQAGFATARTAGKSGLVGGRWMCSLPPE